MASNEQAGTDALDTMAGGEESAEAIDARQTVVLDIDEDLVKAFQQTGPGWRERMEAILTNAAKNC